MALHRKPRAYGGRALVVGAVRVRLWQPSAARDADRWPRARYDWLVGRGLPPAARRAATE